MAAHTNAQTTDNLAKCLEYFKRKYKYDIRLNYVHWRRKWRPYLIFNSVSWRSYAVLGTLTTVSKHWNGVRMGKHSLGLIFSCSISCLLYKVPKPTAISDFRPISVTPYFSLGLLNTYLLESGCSLQSPQICLQISLDFDPLVALSVLYQICYTMLPQCSRTVIMSGV